MRALIATQLRGPKTSFARVRRQLDKIADGNDPEMLQAFVDLWADTDADVRFWAMTYAHPMLTDGVNVDGLGARLNPLLSDHLPANRQMAMSIFATVHARVPKSLIQLVVANIQDTRVNTSAWPQGLKSESLRTATWRKWESFAQAATFCSTSERTVPWYWLHLSLFPQARYGLQTASPTFTGT